MNANTRNAALTTVSIVAVAISAGAAALAGVHGAKGASYALAAGIAIRAGLQVAKDLGNKQAVDDLTKLNDVAVAERSPTPMRPTV